MDWKLQPEFGSSCENPAYIEKVFEYISITKFYNSDEVKVTPAELRFNKTRPASFYKEHYLL